MWKFVGGFVAGIAFIGLMAWHFASNMMFTERVSPFGMEETIARIQHNIIENPTLKAKGWTLAGLRNPGKAVEHDGGNVLPVMMIETCATRYSKPILKDDTVRFLSILMPCKISVYKKNDGKIYIATMNAGLMGKMFGPLVGSVMGEVAEDQKLFLQFDASKPAPAMILPAAPAAGGGAGGGGGGGC